MAKLYFSYATMNAGKSTLLLQASYNYRERGMRTAILIASFDDPAATYVPELEGTLHGEASLRQLANMTSGAEVVHERDNASIYPGALLGNDPDIARTVSGWNQRREAAGARFNYNELCALALGMVIRRVTGTSLSAFAEQALWRHMGAEGDATWLTDARGAEFNSIGFAARLRDWARLARVVAQRGRGPDGQPIVSGAWIDEISRWGERDAAVRYGWPRPAIGYKALFWHSKADGSRPAMHGHHGQRVVHVRIQQTFLRHGHGQLEAAADAVGEIARRKEVFQEGYLRKRP